MAPEVMAAYTECISFMPSIRESERLALPDYRVFRRDDIYEVLAERIVGQQVQVTELDGGPIDDAIPITRYCVASSGCVETTGESDLVFYPKQYSADGKTTLCIPSERPGHIKKVKGRIVGLDIENNAFVVRPRGIIRFDRFWVTPVNEDQEQLVELNFL